MTNEEAKKMLKAKLECFKNETSGINHDCNMRLCDGCSLNYEQGNMGEQKEALDLAIKALEQEPCEKCEIGNPCLYCEYDFTEKKTKESCDDCISRKAVKEMLTAEWTKYMPMELDINLSFVLDKISELPSVIPKPKIGKWIDDVIENEDTNLPIQVCSICKTFYPLSYTGGGHNYCPNCGAKMEVEDD